MNRKATFAKRQRETDLKDHARSKEARKAARKDGSRAGKGPEIAWDEAVYPTTETPDNSTNAGAQVPASNAAPAGPPDAASLARAHEAAAAARANAEKPGEKPNGTTGTGTKPPSLVPRDDSAS